MARAYKVVGGGTARIAGSMTEARAARDEIVAAVGVKKKDVTITEVDIPTKKAELIPYLNGLIIDMGGNLAQPSERPE
jgi:hypothetical protein